MSALYTFKIRQTLSHVWLRADCSLAHHLKIFAFASFHRTELDETLPRVWQLSMFESGCEKFGAPFSQIWGEKPT